MESKSNFINATSNTRNLIGWIFCIVLWVVGLLNLFLVHPVPAIIYFLLSLVYFPPANDLIKKRSGLSIPLVFKFILAIFIIMF